MGDNVRFRFPVQFVTKSDLGLNDLETLRTISEIYAVVSITIKTADDELGRKIDPGVPYLLKAV